MFQIAFQAAQDAVDHPRRPGVFAMLAAAGLDSRDGALATQLCFGVLQNRILLDFYLSHFSNLPLKRMEGRVVEALRLGCYQMLFLDKISSDTSRASMRLTGLSDSFLLGTKKRIQRKNFVFPPLDLNWVSPQIIRGGHFLFTGGLELQDAQNLPVTAGDVTKPPCCPRRCLTSTGPAALGKFTTKSGGWFPGRQRPPT